MAKINSLGLQILKKDSPRLGTDGNYVYFLHESDSRTFGYALRRVGAWGDTKLEYSSDSLFDWNRAMETHIAGQRHVFIPYGSDRKEYVVRGNLSADIVIEKSHEPFKVKTTDSSKRHKSGWYYKSLNTSHGKRMAAATHPDNLTEDKASYVLKMSAKDFSVYLDEHPMTDEDVKTEREKKNPASRGTNPYSAFFKQDDELPNKEYPYFFDTGAGRFAYKNLLVAKQKAREYLQKAQNTSRGYNFHTIGIRYLLPNGKVDTITQITANTKLTTKDNPTEPDEINESNEATELFEEFKGRSPEPDECFDVEEVQIEPDHYAPLADVIEIGLYDGNGGEIPIDLSEENLILAAAPLENDGVQLYLIGNVEINDDELDELGVPTNVSNKAKFDLGPVSSITYYSDKQQFDDDAKKGANWYHVFGEDLTFSGKREKFKKIQQKLNKGESTFPVLVYDRLSKTLELVGGSYHVDESGVRN